MQQTNLVHVAARGQGAGAAGASEMQGASCLGADHLVAAAACSQLPVHELCNKWSQCNNFHY